MFLKKKIVLSVLFFGAIASSIIFLSASIINGATDESQKAVNYILTKPQNAWTTMALSAAGQNNIPSDHLKNITSSNANDYSSAILAITAINQNPKTFGGSDYVAKLESFFDGTQLGDSSLLNDDIFSLLALTSAGESSSNSIVLGTKNYIISKQNFDGGWGWSPSASSDSNMTSAAIMALISAGVSNTDTVVRNAVEFLKTMQNQDGGFSYDASGTEKISDAASDSWVVSAIYAAGQNPSQWTKGDKDPIINLKSLQDASKGFFHHQSGDQETSFSATESAYAVLALEGKFFPLNIFNQTQTFPFRIEGKDKVICQGNAEGPTAMDIVKNAANICNFTYNIQTTPYGPYLTAIANDTASGNIGWLYLVNGASLSVGAADYAVKQGDDVLWYFGDFAWKPTKLEMENDGTNVNLHAIFFDGASWQNLSGATLHIGESDFITDSSGKYSISIASLQNGLYKIFAEKNGYVRSNQATLTVGQAPSDHGVGLNVNIIQTQASPSTNQDSITFSVSPSAVDFGDMKVGNTKSKTVSLSNTGSQDLFIKAEVKGAQIFKNNLSVNRGSLENFSANILKGASSDIQLGLSIPNNYSGSFGSQEGNLIFWATAQ